VWRRLASSEDKVVRERAGARLLHYYYYILAHAEHELVVATVVRAGGIGWSKTDGRFVYLLIDRIFAIYIKVYNSTTPWF
jgi:hypothetical protein